jgi:putative membrane protein
MIIKGFVLGFTIVLPGMSGGTVLIVLGLYESLIKDLAKLKLKPYWPLLAGSIAGIFTGGLALAMVFTVYRDPAAAFLMGCLLASIRAVFRERPALSPVRIIILITGLITGFLVAAEPISFVGDKVAVHWLVLVVGGALSSATMLIPGLPGSSVLIVLGIYDSILLYVRELALLQLAFFGIGSLLGIYLSAKVLDKLFERYQAPIAYFFAGLIAGSSRSLLPDAWVLPVILALIAGFALVWWWSGKKEEVKEEAEDGQEVQRVRNEPTDN